MSSLFGLLSIARDGMQAQTAGLSVASQNIAGAASPDYVKRRVRLETPPVAGDAGGGVLVAGIDRNVDAFATARVVEQEGRLASAQTREGVLANFEVLASPIGDNVLDRMDALFASFTDVASTPADNGAREAALARAEGVALRFNEIASTISDTRQELYLRAQSEVGEINQRLDRLAEINMQVIEAVGRGENAADLRDQRDLLVREVGQRLGVHGSEDPTGNLTLYGAGTTLIDRDQGVHLQVALDATGALAFAVDRRGTASDVTAAIESGTLGGIRRARDEDIASLSADIDQLAYDFTSAMNALHTSGYGLDGATGRPLFTPLAGVGGAAGTMQLDVAMRGHPERLGASASAGEVPGGNAVARKLADFGNVTLGAGGTAAERAASFSERLGFMKADATSEVQLREDTVTTAHSLREATSGVSTDEELVDMQQFQRAYQASLRVMRTADELLQELMRI